MTSPVAVACDGPVIDMFRFVNEEDIGRVRNVSAVPSATCLFLCDRASAIRSWGSNPQEDDDLIVEAERLGSEPEEPDSGRTENDDLAEFNMYDEITIGDPPLAVITLRTPATWPPALGYPACRWWRAALPVTM